MAGETTTQNTTGLPLYLPRGSERATRRLTFEVTTGELELNDIIQSIELPKGALIVGGFLATDDLDTHACPTITIDVGTGDDPDGLLDGTTIAQGGGHAAFNGDLLRDGAALTVDDTVDVKIATAAATAAAGTVTLVVDYINGDDNLDA